MRRHALGALGLLSLVAIAPSLGCDELACGYGGPGCGAPGMTGACGGALVLETPTEVTITYFDDTGAHEARVTSVSSDASVLEVTRVAGATGRFVLTAHVEGPSMLTATIEGWTAAQSFTLTGVTSPRCTDAASSDGGCGCASIEGFSLSR